MTHRRAALIVRPAPSRGLGAFYRNLGITMLATHLRHHGLPVELADLSFDDLGEKLTEIQPTVALFSLYIDDFDRGIQIAEQIKQAEPTCVTVVGGPDGWAPARLSALEGRPLLPCLPGRVVAGLPTALPVLHRSGCCAGESPLTRSHAP